MNFEIYEENEYVNVSYENYEGIKIVEKGFSPVIAVTVENEGKDIFINLRNFEVAFGDEFAIEVSEGWDKFSRDTVLNSQVLSGTAKFNTKVTPSNRYVTVEFYPTSNHSGNKYYEIEIEILEKNA